MLATIHRLRDRAALLLVALAFLSSGYTAHAASSEPLCFSQTGLCINGRFRDYWTQNGGLPLFGLPLTPTAMERNADSSQTVMGQWYERNRFELHPEYAAPYDVLLGRLGADRLRQLGRTWQTEPQANGPQAGCLWFPETKHNVCDYDTSFQGAQAGFKSYWQAEGLRDPGLNGYQQSLALHGLPLTEARMATNSSGETVLTQWFERDRFEWHPQNPAGFRVQLGLLGRELRPTEANLPQVAADFQRQAVGIRPVLAPSWVPEGMTGHVLVSNGQAHGVEYRDPQGTKVLSLVVAVANPPLPGPSTDQSNPMFRHGRAFYQVMDRNNPVSARQFMWNEPGEWHTATGVLPDVPYYLTAEGLTGDEFMQVAGALYTPGS